MNYTFESEKYSKHVNEKSSPFPQILKENDQIIFVENKTSFIDPVLYRHLIIAKT